MFIRYIGKNWKPLLLAAMPLGMIVGFLPLPQIVYYIGLIFYFFIFASYSEKISVKYLFFIVSLTIGGFIYDSPALFNQWMRYALLVLVLGVTTPLFTSTKAYNIRRKALEYLLYVMSFLAVGSFIGYLFGINFMRFYFATNPSEVYRIDLVGWFGGLTPHSMLLAPIAALAITYFVYKIVSAPASRNKKIFFICCIIASVISLLLTASRGALVSAVAGAAVVGYLSFKGKISKFTKRIALVLGLLAVMYPLYSSYTTGMESKQRANLEKGSTFNSRSDKWEHRFIEFSKSPIFGIGVGVVSAEFTQDYSRSGVIEPGSSWLAILSMTGLFGVFMFLYILVPVVKKLYKKSRKYGGDYMLLTGLMAVLFMHMVVEGYIFSGGSFLCFIFWLIYGVGCGLAEITPGKESCETDSKSLSK